MSNKQRYKETFDTMMLSEERIRKVKSMIEKNGKKKIRRTGFRVAVSAAVLTAVFLIGNVAVYAATGSTLVEKGMEKVSFCVKKDNVSVTGEVIETEKDKDGNTSYEMKSKDGQVSSRISVNNRYLETESISVVAGTDDKELAVRLISARLEKEGKKVYLVIGDKEKRLDITKDFADGTAKGEFELDGESYQFVVAGTVEKNDIEIKQREKE